MAVTGISDAMLQYGKTTEVIYMNKPKTGKPYGIKRPDSRNIIAVLTAIFVVLVAISALM